MDITDRKLVLRMLKGEKSVFGILVERYEKIIYAVAYSYLHNVEDARDLAQDVFVKAYDSLRTLKDPGKLGAWLNKITSRLAIDRLRTRKKRISLPEFGLLEDSLASGPSGRRMTPQETETLRHRLMLINRLVKQLPDYYRVAFILKYMEGLSNREIANFLDVPMTTVEGRLHKAREFLREHMDS